MNTDIKDVEKVVKRDDEKHLTSIIFSSKNNDGKTVKKDIGFTNFTIYKKGIGKKIENFETEEDKKETYWLIEFWKEGKEMPILIEINTKIFSNIGDFKSFFNPYGGIFIGNQVALDFYFYLLEAQLADFEYIVMANTCGFYMIEEKPIWIFRNGFYFREHFTSYKTLQNGFYFYENNQKAFLFRLKNNYYEISPEYSVENTNNTIDDILIDIFSFFKNKKIYPTLILAWLIGTLRKSEILTTLNQNFFPLLFVCGRSESGKTEIISLFLNLIGMGHVIPSSWRGVTNFVNQKMIGMNSHFPMWRDEYRDKTGGVQDEVKEEFLRSIYSFMPILKGTKEQEVNTYSVTSTFILSGEDVPQDPATQRRGILIFMTEQDKLNPNEFRGIQKKSKTWFRFWHFSIKHKINKKRLEDHYNFFLNNLSDLSRIRFNLACLLAISMEFFNNSYSEKEQEEIRNILLQETYSTFLKGGKKENMHIDDNVQRFFEMVQIAIMKDDRQKLRKYISFKKKNEEDEKPSEIRIHVKGLNELISEANKKDNIKIGAIQRILVEEYNGQSGIPVNLDGKTCRVTVLEYAKCPFYIQELEQNLKEEKEKEQEDEKKRNDRFNISSIY